MKGNGTSWLWRSGAQCLLGSIAVALLTLVCFRLRVNLATACLLYLMVVVLLSVMDAFVASLLVSLIAVLCLDYFFIKPLFSLRMNDPLNIVAVIVFVATSLLITRLMSQRKRAEAALKVVLGELESKVQQRTAELAKANDDLRSEMGERQRAEEALQKAQAELAHVTRVMTLGELMASIAHEVNQPLAAVVTNAQACLRWLALQTPNLDEARAAVERIVREGNRASEVIRRIRALAKKTDPQMVSLDINDVIREAISLEQREVLSQRVSLRTELASALPPVLGDRVQLQQVVINLVMNALEAMAPVTDRPRTMLIRSQPHDAGEVLVAVQDSGIGIDSGNAERLFNAFFTTKASGMGMGLSISRSIIAAHGGNLFVSPNADHGATFQFTLPRSGLGVS
ncbi:MAG TPA: ATP-binding protein [Candidatus Binataceae bacterium]|nr:ATP-binding protein [Candidatus Binataceae bacterium]